MTNLFQSSEMTGSLHGHTHWLIRFHDVVLMVLGMLGFLADSFISSGRWRFYLLVASTLCFGLGALLWYYPIRSRAGDTQFWSSPPVLSRARLETVTPSAPSLGVDEAVPIHAPPFPGNAGAELGMPMSPDALSSSAALPTSLALQVGGAVLLNGQGPTSALVGQRGVITAVNGGIFEVKLDSGLTLGQLTSSCLTLVPTAEVPAVQASAPAGGDQGVKTDEFYAPFAAGAEIKGQTTSRSFEGCFGESSCLG